MKFNPWFVALFFFVAYFAAGVALLDGWGFVLIIFSTAICLVIGDVVPDSFRQKSLLGITFNLIGITLLFGLVSCCVIPAMFTGPMGHPFNCRRQCYEIGFALRDYEWWHGRFPDAIVKNEAGEPLYSWRVSLLENFRLEDVANEIDLSQPWDAPQNRPTTSQRIAEYDNRAYGPGNLSPFRMISTGDAPNVRSPHERILVVETMDAVPWAKPDEFTRDQAVELLTSARENTLPHTREEVLFWQRPGYLHAITTDGRVLSLHGNLPRDLAEVMLSGDQPWDEERLSLYSGEEMKVNSKRVSGFIFYIGLTLAQIVWWIRHPPVYTRRSN